MDILILGGTKFLGRSIADVCIKKGHRLTLFNRGLTNPDLFSDTEKFIGDRSADLSQIPSDRKWDAVIDTSGYLPAVVKNSVKFFAQKTNAYVFISSISVYGDFTRDNITEDTQVSHLEHPFDMALSDETYGPLKVACEDMVLEQYQDNAILIRPGLIVGPHDPTDRFTYWPYRISQGGEIICPGSPKSQIQFIDVRDLAEWTIHLIENHSIGIFNATGPAIPLTMGAFLTACKNEAKSQAILHWVDENILLANQVIPWSELPLWTPELDPESKLMYTVDIQRALSHGLSFRPLSQTIKDTLSWLSNRGPEVPLKTGLSVQKENQLWETIRKNNF